ncbi:MAG: hypothetical protein FJW30_15255 [Acidobacteria bacterium]|nr:hypothetical protein [Acidobacteriota bacterium]
MRAIFRICFRKFRQCLEKEKSLSGCTLQYTGGKRQSFAWGRKNEEYIADFLLVVQRELDERDYKIFRMKFLLGADWRLCCPRLNMEKGIFFHEVYRIEAQLGRALREMQPYALFPTDEYFGGATREFTAHHPPSKGPRPLHPPLARDLADDDLPLAA